MENFLFTETFRFLTWIRMSHSAVRVLLWAESSKDSVLSLQGQFLADVKGKHAL